MNIRRNADGKQNLRDLRSALAETDTSIYREGSNWIISEWSAGHCCYMLTPCDYRMDERQALQKALYGEHETDASGPTLCDTICTVSDADRIGPEDGLILGTTRPDPDAERWPE